MEAAEAAVETLCSVIHLTRLTHSFNVFLRVGKTAARGNQICIYLFISRLVHDFLTTIDDYSLFPDNMSSIIEQICDHVGFYPLQAVLN